MENHLFLWLRNRTTDNRKCEKARNIKGKRTIEMFSTASKPLVAHRSSASADFPANLQIQHAQSLGAVAASEVFFVFHSRNYEKISDISYPQDIFPVIHAICFCVGFCACAGAKWRGKRPERTLNFYFFEPDFMYILLFIYSFRTIEKNTIPPRQNRVLRARVCPIGRNVLKIK